MTRAEILGLSVGDCVRELITGERGDNRNGSHYGKNWEVTRIYRAGVTRKGRAYVNFFVRFGEHELGHTAVEGSEKYMFSAAEEVELPPAPKRMSFHFGSGERNHIATATIGVDNGEGSGWGVKYGSENGS